ncbi:MAG: glyoxalase [Eubacterium sp.]|nr:glyoxalase [Eubacterium sp.]
MDGFGYDDECLAVFLRDQGRLFDEPVAETPEEAQAILEDVLAVVCDGIGEVRDYMDESGMDLSGVTDDNLRDAAEVFELSNDRYLVVLA